MKKILILTLSLSLVVLTGCSLFTKEDIVVEENFDEMTVNTWDINDSDVVDTEIGTGTLDEIIENETTVDTWDLEIIDGTWEDIQWKEDVEQMIEERQKNIDLDWDLTEDDIALAEDILDTLLENLLE